MEFNGFRFSSAFFTFTDYNMYMYKKGVDGYVRTNNYHNQVMEVLDKLRPFLLRDGGDCELVDIEDGIVKLRLLGACELPKFNDHIKSWN